MVPVVLRPIGSSWPAYAADRDAAPLHPNLPTCLPAAAREPAYLQRQRQHSLSRSRRVRAAYYTSRSAAAAATTAAGTGAESGLPGATASSQPSGLETAQAQPAQPSAVQHAGQVAVCQVQTLAAVPCISKAVELLKDAACKAQQRYGHYPSGLVRFEVPLPRGATALRWLQGQPKLSALQPQVYFSPRRSSAPNTAGGDAAEGAAGGSGAVAGAGAAWRWQGAAGQAISEGVVQDVQRFLSPSAPRVRALGGMRFNAEQSPSPEWREFGSYCLMIPRLEFLEADNCDLLSCTLAWSPEAAAETAQPAQQGTSRAQHAQRDHNSSRGAYSNNGNGVSTGAADMSRQRSTSSKATAVDAGAGGGGILSAHNVGGRGFDTLAAAAADASAALQSMAAAACPTAPSFQVLRDTLCHIPDEQGWRDMMEPVHDSLQPSATAGACQPLSPVDPGTALEEYSMNGQAGLDGLLAALDNGFQGSGGVPEGEEGLTKVVLARRSDVQFRGLLDPLALLQTLQERDPRAYQIYLQLPSGATFLGSTPEQLYARSGRSVASEAVAGTRPRGPPGDVEKDFWLAFDLLRNPKDHVEFTIVRNWVRDALAGVSERVVVDREKSVLKQGAVQHLYGRLSAMLKPDINDAALLAVLHPTPAVCGRPREAALSMLTEGEPFDRGFYAGPFGWISGSAAEFAVAIRSALVHPSPTSTKAHVPPSNGSSSSSSSSSSTSWPSTSNGGSNGNGCADGNGAGRSATAHKNGATGAGESSPIAAAAASIAGRPLPSAAAVPNNATGSGGGASSIPPNADWWTSTAIAPEPSLGESVAETRTISLFAGVGIVQGSDAVSEWQELDLKIRQYELLLRQTPSWAAAPNVNLLWARLMVEELCRLGVNTFCVAPGSRSSPLTVAVSMHPRARIVPCIDERSLAFWALGYGRATRMPAAVITSSGTAVANLLPAVIEASQSNVPLLLLTADRPGELRDTSANQTIDQVKIFGGCTRWAVDVPPPDPAVPARMVLTTVDTAVRYATGTPAGPVHLNCQFREPLAPVQAAWPEPVLQGLDRWTSSTAPFTAPVSIPAAATLSTAATDGSLAALLGALQTTQRGLLVVGELATPADCVAAQQISSTLQWPVVADVLSGLKVGSRSTSAPAAPATLQFFDHLLLDKEAWPALRPEVVLQLGGRLTSKRTAQFLEWAALGDVSASRGACTWIFADETPQRHDAAHLLSHRMQLPLATLAQGLAQGMASEQRRRTPYGHLLTMLDETAGREISLALQEIGVLTEPHVARALSQALPPGDGLFLGNSMPIRDMDMYALHQHSPHHPGSNGAANGTLHGSRGAEHSTQGFVDGGLGVPVASNRGASGIDGVLSTAAGFAFGLDRGVTLVVGDVSFLHDINGLNLLRSGEMRPPLTVVLINNGGGGIFSFLPIADSIPEDVFTQLWTTPQNVDLAGMCRAHGIPHQKVTQQSELGPALAGAWGLNRHSVVEVVTDRTTNVDYHRQIQQAVARTTRRALKAAAPLVTGASSLRLLLNSAGCPGLRVLHASYQQYSLPLQQPITTGVDDHLRKGLLVYLELSDAGGRRVRGVGEVAPLPGLHTETLLEAQRQLALLCALLHGVTIPPTLSLLQGRMAEWLDRSIGVDPTNIHPSVRCGLEGAVLSALSVAQHVQQQPGGRPEHRLSAQLSTTGGSSSSSSSEVLLINGLVSPAVDQPPAAAAQQAATLVAAGYSCLKVKVARRVDPVEDAAVLIAIRKAVGPAVALRADANRKWTLQQATDFGLAAREVRLQYLEEPCQGVHDIAEFHRQTGIPVALDETLDEALTQQPAPSHSMAAGSTQYSGGSDNLSASHAAHAVHNAHYTSSAIQRTSADGGSLLQRLQTRLGPWTGPNSGVVALVVKPSIVGGFETTAGIARWACRRGLQVVVSSAFESSLGLAQFAQLAGSLDQAATETAACGRQMARPTPQPVLSGQPGAVTASATAAAGAADSVEGIPVAHGLGTAHWFTNDVVIPALSPVQAVPNSGADRGMSGGVAMSLDQAQAVITALAQGLPPDSASIQAGTAAPGATIHAESSTPADSTQEGAHAASVKVDGSASHGSTRDDMAGPAQPVRNPSVFSTERSAAALAEGFKTVSMADATYRFRVLDSTTCSSGGQHSISSSFDGYERNLSSSGTASTSIGDSVSHTPHADDRKHVQPIKKSTTGPVVLFLHGFLGTADDWRPLMAALSPSCRCLAIDLPGHGQTQVTIGSSHAGLPAAHLPAELYAQAPRQAATAFSITAVADGIAALVEQLGIPGSTLVGYSLGARLALQLAADHGGLFSRVVSVSGTAGIPSAAARDARAARDDQLARAILDGGAPAFVQEWYAQHMWKSLRRHSRFVELVEERAQAHAPGLAAALSGMSTGRQPPLWSRLPVITPQLVFVAGAEDAKFEALAHKMAGCVNTPAVGGAGAAESMRAYAAAVGVAGTRLVDEAGSPLAAGQPVLLSGADASAAQVPAANRGVGLHIVRGAGHAVHIERPEALLSILTESAVR